MIFFIVPWLRRLVAGLSPRRTGLDLKSAHVILLLGQVFLLVFCFSLTIALHQCFIVIFIYVLLLTEWQTGETSEHFSSQCSFGSRGPLARKIIYICVYLYICINILYTHLYNMCTYALFSQDMSLFFNPKISVRLYL